MNWALTRPLRAEREADPLHRVHDQVHVAVRDVLRREHRDRVARVDARPLDVLEQARDEHADAVAHGVDVDLDALEEAVDAHGPVRVDDGGRGEVAGEVLGRVREVDREPADDERRPDDDRVADPLRERQRLLDRLRHAALGLRDAQPVQERGEPDPLLGLVDRLEVRAEQRHARRRRAARRG